MDTLCRPSGAWPSNLPTAHAVGYLLSSLAGLAKKVKTILHSVGQTPSSDFSPRIQNLVFMESVRQTRVVIVAPAPRKPPIFGESNE